MRPPLFNRFTTTNVFFLNNQNRLGHVALPEVESQWIPTILKDPEQLKKNQQHSIQLDLIKEYIQSLFLLEKGVEGKIPPFFLIVGCDPIHHCWTKKSGPSIYVSRPVKPLGRRHGKVEKERKEVLDETDCIDVTRESKTRKRRSRVHLIL